MMQPQKEDYVKRLNELVQEGRKVVDDINEALAKIPLAPIEDGGPTMAELVDHAPWQPSKFGESTSKKYSPLLHSMITGDPLATSETRIVAQDERGTVTRTSLWVKGVRTSSGVYDLELHGDFVNRYRVRG